MAYIHGYVVVELPLDLTKAPVAVLTILPPGPPPLAICIVPITLGIPALFTIPAVTAGMYLEQGLPNATGAVSISYGGRSVSGSGVFKTSIGGSYTNQGQSGAGTVNINFSLSNSNVIFGKSNNVQPNALTLCFYVKY